MADTTKRIIWNPNQINQPTPLFIIMGFRVVFMLSLVWAAAIQPRLHNSADVDLTVDTCLLIFDKTVYFFCLCFGYKQPTGTPEPNSGVSSELAGTEK